MWLYFDFVSSPVPILQRVLTSKGIKDNFPSLSNLLDDVWVGWLHCAVSVGIETLSFLYSDCLLLIIHYQINSHRFFSTVSLPPTGGKPLMKVSSKLKEVLKEHISKMELRLHEEQKKVNHPWHWCISLWLWGETVRLVALWPCCLVTLSLLYCLVPSNAAVVFALLPCCLVTVWLLLYCLLTAFPQVSQLKRLSKAQESLMSEEEKRKRRKLRKVSDRLWRLHT